MALARESGELIAADSSGGLYRLDRQGQIVALTRGMHSVEEIAWSDTGQGGAVLTDDSTVSLLDKQFSTRWTVRLHADVLGLAVDPTGRHVAISLANGNNVILNDRKKHVAQFDTMRPLSFLQFLITEPALIGAADYGLLCRHRVHGAAEWSEATWSNAGSMSATGDGRAIFLAAFSYGIQRFDEVGQQRGTYMVEGTPHRVAASYLAERLVVATMERKLYWLDGDGEMLWATQLPDDVGDVCCDPLGKGIVVGFESGRLVALDWGHPEDG